MMRIDRLLWFLRLAPSRSLAQRWVADGHIRINGRRIERTAAPVCEGDVLTLPLGSRVRVIELLEEPRRRGPAGEARALYRELDPHGKSAIAAGETPLSEGELQP